MKIIASRRALALLMVFAMALTAFSALTSTVSYAHVPTYYVNQDPLYGDDSNNGSSSAPFATLQKALGEVASVIVLLSDYTTAEGENVTIPDGKTLDLNGFTLTISSGTIFTNSGSINSLFDAHIAVSGTFNNVLGEITLMAGTLTIDAGGEMLDEPLYPTAVHTITVNGIYLNRDTTAPAFGSLSGSGAILFTDVTFGTYAQGVLYVGSNNTANLTSITFTPAGTVTTPAGTVTTPTWLGKYFIVATITTMNGPEPLSALTNGSYTFCASPTAPNEFSEIKLDGFVGVLIDVPIFITPTGATMQPASTPRAGGSSPRTEYSVIYYTPSAEGGYTAWYVDGGYDYGAQATVTSRAPAGLVRWASSEGGATPHYNPGDKLEVTETVKLYAVVQATAAAAANEQKSNPVTGR